MPSAAQVGAMPSRGPTSVTVAMRSARLTGKNAADPLGSVAQRAALVKARLRLPQRRGEGPEGHNPEGGASFTPPPVLGGRPWEHARGAGGGGANA